MPRSRKQGPASPDRQPPADREQADRETPELRIIGGTLRHRKLLYSGDQRTRPMKDRVREAVFNLVGPVVVGQHAIDLFAGTGHWDSKLSAGEPREALSSSSIFRPRG